MGNEKKKVVLITGASSGIGKATAIKLLENGHVVYGAARNMNKMDDLKSLGGKIIHLDVTLDDSVVSCVEQVVQEQGRIDVLFNNAGYGAYGPIEDVSIDEIKKQFDVNVFGIARVLKAVLPYMRKRKEGLIINTASVAGHLSSAILGWYSATKHAVEAISDALRQEVKHLDIKIVIIEPGIIKTGFDAVAFDLMDEMDISPDYEALVSKARIYYAGLYERALGPEDTASAVVNAIESQVPDTRYRTTPNAKTLIDIRKSMSDDRFDAFILDQYDKAN